MRTKFLSSVSFMIEDPSFYFSSANLEEAKERCEKASVLLPRSGSQHTEDMKQLMESIKQALGEQKDE